MIPGRYNSSVTSAGTTTNKIYRPSPVLKKYTQRRRRRSTTLEKTPSIRAGTGQRKRAHMIPKSTYRQDVVLLAVNGYLKCENCLKLFEGCFWDSNRFVPFSLSRFVIDILHHTSHYFSAGSVVLSVHDHHVVGIV